VNAYPAVDGPDPQREPALATLVAELRRRFHDAVAGILVYGSCLRSGDIFDGLLDVYVVCDGYWAAYRRPLPAFANRLLPPNVFYCQVPAGDRMLRSKVTVISRRDFGRGCSPRWFQSYIWGRFAQPVHILYTRDAAVRADLEAALLSAVRTLLQRSLPVLPASGTLAGLWSQALSLSYATELRTERGGRAGELVAAAQPFYREVTTSQGPLLRPPLQLAVGNGEPRYRWETGPLRRRSAAVGWWLRRLQGKPLSVLRLLKALFTFQGGLDYIAWKLERHSGETIAIPDRVRRYPLLFAWGFFWQLYRRGVFR
jgi:hypothetical protein